MARRRGALGSLGEANKRLEGRIGDCRGWGRYIGRIYRGASKKTMVVIETCFPDAAYETNDATRGDYSQTLGARAAAALPGASATWWKRGAKPPKPTLVHTNRPKRLLIDDLTMHLRPYACDVDCTIVIMGDLNTDLVSRTGYDNRALKTMIDDLGLVSCAGARWPASSCVTKTHKGDEMHASSHINYIFISKRNATAVRQFGIDADRGLMVDFDHAVLFADIGMFQVLRLKRTSPQPQVPVRRKSKIRYSDTLHQHGHPEKRKRAEQFDTHKVNNSKVDALTHQLDGAIPPYVSFRHALRGHTTIWYEPLEEENVGHGGCHEVTGDLYKHITASAQRRLSIERVGVKDGAFLATFGKGAIGRARSESRSAFVSKLTHEHLATEARQEMWGRAIGRVGHMRLRLCAQLGCPRRGESSAAVAHARARSSRRERHQGSLACLGTIGAIQVDKAPRCGRRNRGLLGNDRRPDPHWGAATRAAAGVRRRWSRSRTLAAGPRTPPPPRRASARPRAGLGLTTAQRRTPTTTSLT